MAKNDSGFDDSQSIACDCYNALTNELIGEYGSVSIASKSTGITKCGILYQLNNANQPIRKNLYFVPHGEGQREHDIIVQYDMNTDEEINRFVSVGKASECTRINRNTIDAQIKLNQKPNWSKSSTYFKKITI